MVYITGDIHGNPSDIIYMASRCRLTKDDIIVLLGDVGANYFLNKRDLKTKKDLSEYIEATILCIHGNHEARPSTVEGYELYEWNGGEVWIQPEYPNLLFAKDGSIFNLDGLNCLVLGGAYSVDKHYRLERGYAWFEDEQPSEEIKAYVAAKLEAVNNKVDVVFSHTCPLKYEPIEVFLPGIDQSKVDKSTEKWLDEIDDKLDYKAWYCGHWHINKRIAEMHFLYDGLESLDDLKREEEDELW
jgi:3-oxoacid CoA-transferase subunit A